MLKKISHLGMAVKDLEESREFYRSIFGLESSEPMIVGEGTMKVSLVEIGDAIIELLQPVGEEGVMAKFLQKRGEGFHHICYEVDDINTAIEAVKTKGMDVLGEPHQGAEGLVIFLHPRGTHGVLVELVEKNK
ncbi:methylmalonyl-CoA epimerase [candidate division CSSED10-310 bacterium]|uniref:Methylmalonyl-CoA epimerase n=1 Tax=candidate division CSSED10-310 bacterium TaxID=2855610 RepID=A0ABV6Z2S6_UNCC1